MVNVLAILSPLVALLLLLTTALYAIATWKMLSVMRDQHTAAGLHRKASIRPILVFRSDEYGPGDFPRAGIFNVGNGVALNVHAYSRNPEGAPAPRQDAASLGPGDAYWLEQWYEDFSSPAVIWITYQDAEGNPYYSRWDPSDEWQIAEGALSPEPPRAAPRPDAPYPLAQTGESILRRRDARVARFLTKAEKDLLAAAAREHSVIAAPTGFLGPAVQITDPTAYTPDGYGGLSTTNLVPDHPPSVAASYVEALEHLVELGCVRRTIPPHYCLTARGHRIGANLRRQHDDDRKSHET